MRRACSNCSLCHHSDGKDRPVRRIFDRLLETVGACGPVVRIPRENRIAIRAEVRLAGCVVGKKWLLANPWLAPRIDHARLERVAKFGPGCYGLRVRADDAGDIDAAPVAPIERGHRVGLRQHLEPAGS